MFGGCPCPIRWSWCHEILVGYLYSCDIPHRNLSYDAFSAKCREQKFNPQDAGVFCPSYKKTGRGICAEICRLKYMFRPNDLSPALDIQFMLRCMIRIGNALCVIKTKSLELLNNIKLLFIRYLALASLSRITVCGVINVPPVSRWINQPFKNLFVKGLVCKINLEEFIVFYVNLHAMIYFSMTWW